MPSQVNDDDSQPAAVEASSVAKSTIKPTANRSEDVYRVQVKPEHVLSDRPPCLAPPADPPPREDKNNNGDDKQGGKRRSRGQNKKRPRDNKISFADKACLAVVRGQPCPFQNSAKGCKYNHDLKEMLANRPLDISEGEGGAWWLKGGCPSWRMKGYCDFGIMCRLGSSHVNMSTGQNLCRRVDEDRKETIGPPSISNGSKVKKNGDTAKATGETPETAKDDGVEFKEKVIETTKNAGAIEVKEEAPKTEVAKFIEEIPATTNHNGVNSVRAKAEAPETNKAGVAKVKEEASDKPKPGPGTLLGHQREIKNVLSKETQIKLRKNQYPFVCKRHFDTNNDKNSKKPSKMSPQNSPVVRSTTTPVLPAKERKLVDFRNKVYIAPLTTVGNLPFRRIMKHYGADITCGEMALSNQLLSGKSSEWALLKRHPCEDVFGVQIASGHADQYTRVGELLANEDNMEIDFVDLNLGCPIDLVCEKGAGASLMMRERKLKGSLEGLLKVLPCQVTIKMRTGWNENTPIAHQLVPKIQSWGIEGIGAFMLHGRSRLQRYSRSANWDYISQVACSQSPDLQQIGMIGNGDIFSYTDYEENILKRIEEGDDGSNKNNLLPTAMLGRGALIKPWLPTEIKERRHWDISATERLDMLKEFVKFGLEHWGSDQQGVNSTRRFLLEWLSFLHRYVPVGMLEVIPQHMNQRPPNNMCGRSDLETMMLSKNCADWVKISEMLLGPVPDGFLFEPKHKANSYTKA